MDASFFSRIPKVELHVHLEGSIRPETVLKLARRNGISLPADSVEGLREWYRFRDFPHFIEVYVAVSKCIRSAEDVELVLREFLQGQAEQNILHTEVTYTASTIERFAGVPWKEQEGALTAALEYAKSQCGVTAGLILDIVRGCEPELAVEVAERSVACPAVVALGIAGEECRGTAQYREAFDVAKKAGLPIIPHAGETRGPESIREALELTDPVRIEHGVRCLEDAVLTRELVSRQVPLDICPSSNVALGVFAAWADHPMARMLDAGLYVTLNSDDPPMFGTSLSCEFERAAETFDLDEDVIWTLCLNAAKASLLPDAAKRDLVQRMREDFTEACQG